CPLDAGRAEGVDGAVVEARRHPGTPGLRSHVEPAQPRRVDRREAELAVGEDRVRRAPPPLEDHLARERLVAVDVAEADDRCRLLNRSELLGCHSRPASTIRWRNCCVRGSRGAVKICSGGPCSQITPPSRKQTRLAMSRANPISCVAISIVMPPSA